MQTNVLLTFFFFLIVWVKLRVYEKMDKIKKNKKLIVIALLAFLLVAIGATYAYFAAQKGTGGSANINVEAGTTDSLTFTKGNPITIDANSDNFKSGEPNQEGDTTVSAHLVANNGNYTASETYNVYLNLINNPFVYTKAGIPELILQVINPDGKPLETLDDTSIKYVSVADVDDEENPLKGFDITTATGLIPIKLTEEISAEPSDDENNGKADETWQIKIILINHDYDQQVNTGKTFNAQAIITAGTLPNVKVETTNITNDSMKVIATISDYEDTIDNVSFKINADEDKDWHEASNEDTNVYSYTFDNLTESKKYEVSTKISFNDEEIVKVIEESITPKKTLADACPNGGNLAECVIGLYNKNSKYEDTKLYYHNGTITEQDANDLSYRFTGGDYQLTQRAKDAQYGTINDIIKLDCNGTLSTNSNDYCATNPKYTLSYNPNIENLTSLKQALTKAIAAGYISDNNIKNFVCFGGDCSNVENLYRIIGAFKIGNEYQIKLVKADEAGKDLLGEDGDFASSGSRGPYNTYLGNHDEWPRYTWDKNGQNVWSNSELNTHNLNETYLGKLNDWANMIATTEWQVGGMTYPLGHEQGARTAYENELGDSKTPLTHSAKIGLMYVTDYYYGATKDRWSLPGYVSTLQDYRLAAWDNWTWIGDDFWFITPNTSAPTHAFGANTFGCVTAPLTTTASYAARPSFYLNSNVMYVWGEGTSSNPIILG